MTSFQSPLYSGALLFKGEKTIGGVPIDAMVRELHRRSSSVTRNPVEDGADIMDHIHNDPDGLNIEGLIGAPISLINISRGSAQYIKDVYETFKRLRLNKTPITVVTGIEVYENMAIEEFNVPRSAKNGLSLEFSMSLVKLNIVESQSVLIPKRKLGGSEGTKRRSSGKTKAGQNTGTPTPEAERTSFLDEIREQIDTDYETIG